MTDASYVDALCKINGILEKLQECCAELTEVEDVFGELNSDPHGTLSDDDIEICTHSCIHHPEVINTGLWSKLGEDLISLVFARLPIPLILELRKCSKVWSAMSDSASFRQAFAEANPKLWGLLGRDRVLKDFHTRIIDATLKEWWSVEMELPNSCKEDMCGWYSSDRGLVCFIPAPPPRLVELVPDNEDDSEDDSEDDEVLVSDSVFVCNPLTSTWRKLPEIPPGYRHPEAIQLEMDRDTGCYKVIVVYEEKRKNDVKSFRAFEYDSKAESWSISNSGVVYGSDNHYVLFDCETNRLFDLDTCPSLRPGFQGRSSFRMSFLKDRMFVLHRTIDPDSIVGLAEPFVISEYTWKGGSTSDYLSKLNDIEVSLSGSNDHYEIEIFTSPGFVLLTWEIPSEDGSVRHRIKMYDISAGQWWDLPDPLINPRTRNKILQDIFMFEMRWDAIP